MPRLVPKRWQNYRSMGVPIPGTKIIAFKVPLKMELYRDTIPEEEWFTPAILLQKQPRLKTVIDLTDTSRYYDPREFETSGVAYVKINIQGGGRLPPDFKVRQFYQAVDEFNKKFANDPDALLGVHCTHGLNRTGYFICKYMIERLAMSPESAISTFEAARGYPMERENYMEGIRNIAKGCGNPNFRPREYSQHCSPLESSYNELPDQMSYYRRPGIPYQGREVNYRQRNFKGTFQGEHPKPQSMPNMGNYYKPRNQGGSSRRGDDNFWASRRNPRRDVAGSGSSGAAPRENWRTRP